MPANRICCNGHFEFVMILPSKKDKELITQVPEGTFRLFMGITRIFVRLLTCQGRLLQIRLLTA